MLKETKDIYSDEILYEALTRFGGDKDNVKDIGGFEAFVYEATINDKKYILKITHTIRRLVNYLMGELDYVNYLASHGVPTSKAVESVNGNFVESIDASDGGKFLAYLFEKAEGEISTKESRTDEIIQTWGQVSGLMNRLAAGYKPSKPEYKRQIWYEDDVYEFDKHLTGEDAELIPLCHQILDEVKTLPQTKETFGMIHGDLHQGNFFINKGQVLPFDFDDCEYGYYMNDIAMPYYYGGGLFKVMDDDAVGYAENFLSQFLKGYQKEFSVPKEIFLQMPEFLRVRAMILYIILNQAWVGDMRDDEKNELIIKFRRHTTGEQIPFEIDYTKFL